MITWDSRSLYDPPDVGVCAVSGKYETGRHYVREGKRIFVGDTSAPEVVENYVEFVTATGSVNAFKRGYSKTEWTAKKVAGK